MRAGATHRSISETRARPAPAPSVFRPSRPSRRVCQTRAATEIRVCINLSCRRQGSRQVAKFLRDLTAGYDGDAITVKECGCLGNCGNGPNMVLLPSELFIAHVATPTDAAEVLTRSCGVKVDSIQLQATQLRAAGNAAAQEENFEEAIRLYTQAIELNPTYSKHLLYSNRSAALLQSKRAEEALADAEAAIRLGPKDYTTGWVRCIDCLYALGRHEEAMTRLQEAEDKCPGFKLCPEYKSIVHALKPANAPHK